MSQYASFSHLGVIINRQSYLGKSTGAGSLAIWTHHLKSISFLDYKGLYYTGKAIKMGAGVQGFEAYSAADKVGLSVTGGECPTVGLAGGYTQGGGHSQLASKYGMAADQALEWEVVDGTGRFLRASRTENLDLFWALSGGGGGTYGVVWSLTSKAHKDIPVSATNLTFTNKGVSQDTFWAAIAAYHAFLPQLVDVGVMSSAGISNTSFGLIPLTAPGISKEQLANLLEPFLATLRAFDIKFTSDIFQFPGYLIQYSTMQKPVPIGVTQTGGRLIPRSVVEKNSEELMAAFRYIVESGAFVNTIALNVSKKVAGDVYNAVLPAWRDALLSVVIST